MRESAIEKKFTADLRRLGCLVYKFVSPGNDGVPDRIVVTPTGRTLYVELKTRRGRLSEIQSMQLARLTKHHADVYVLYGEHQTRDFVEMVRREVSK